MPRLDLVRRKKDGKAANLNGVRALGQFIRDVSDFPRPGIKFKDISPLLNDPDACLVAIHAMSSPWLDCVASEKVSKVVGVESRGFYFGVPIAQRLGVGFVPIRKGGKLPAATFSQSYEREYGPDVMEIHQDALTPQDRVLIVDDVLATAGTALCAADLVEKCGASVAGFSFLIELDFLSGRQNLGDHRVHAVLSLGED